MRLAEMKAQTGHIVFKGQFRYRNLSKSFEELLRAFLEETDQMPDEEDILQMFIRLNMMDITKNRKPEGYNRRGRMRLVFPLIEGRREMYVRADVKTTQVVRVTERLSKILKKAGVSHSIAYDQLKTLQES
ncbi:MAG: hypothetical protein JSV94_03085 [Methanobacteriota archaeon]|nr:MAG: hypothetical protein JSV94_03085 [Euryarchaeota archaeon]